MQLRVALVVLILQVKPLHKSTTKKILSLLKKYYPKPHCALNFKNPLELLIATILSAQCTDERVNKVTEKLFKKYKNVNEYANANLNEFEKDIYSTGFYRNKAKNIISACNLIKDKYKGKVPKDFDKLLELPGVARKTANCVMGNAFNITSGVVVDTHVSRISKKLDLTKNEDPNKIEQDLMKIIPKDEWINFSHRLIWHGRKICDARKPKCEICFLNKLCPAAFKLILTLLIFPRLLLHDFHNLLY